MPLCIEWIGFVATIISLLISFFTLRTSLTVKKQVRQQFERSALRNDIRKIQNQIEGFINSINQDYIFKSDNDRTFRPKLSQFLTELNTNFSFLSHKSMKIINKLQKALYNTHLSNEDWSKIANNLIALKNSLKKESL